VRIAQVSGEHLAITSNMHGEGRLTFPLSAGVFRSGADPAIPELACCP
jgi:hypothetical protein